VATSCRQHRGANKLRDPIAEIIAGCKALRSEGRRVDYEEDRARDLTAEALLLRLVTTSYFGLAGADVGFDLLGLVRAPGEVRAGGYNQSLSVHSRLGVGRRPRRRDHGHQRAVARGTIRQWQWPILYLDGQRDRSRREQRDSQCDLHRAARSP
jgi:hypothetical protein